MMRFQPRRNYGTNTAWKRQDNATIFIEAKRKHLPEIPKILQTNDTFSRHLDDSVVKGIVQIYSLADAILKSRPDCVKNFENFYGIVVSYKNDYLRGGQQFWDEFLRDEIVTKLNEMVIDPNLIPPENIFLLPIDDIDYLMTFLQEHHDETFGSVFSQVKEYESDPARSSFFFHDHLSRIAGGSIPRPEHLWQKIADVIEDVTKKMQQHEAKKKAS